MIEKLIIALVAAVIGGAIGYGQAKQQKRYFNAMKEREYSKGLIRGRSEWITEREAHLRTINRLQEQLRRFS